MSLHQKMLVDFSSIHRKSDSMNFISYNKQSFQNIADSEKSHNSFLLTALSFILIAKPDLGFGKSAF